MIRLIAITVFVNTVFVSTNSTCDLITKPKVRQVPSDVRTWDKTYSDYKPVEWEVPCDEDICDKMRPEYIRFGKESDGVDRTRARSCYRKPPYKLNDAGYPLNPAGRTGIVGRGMLPKWGPNHMIWLMLQRKSKDVHYTFLQVDESGARLPEFIVNSPSGKWFGKEVEERLIERMKPLFGASNEAKKAIGKAEKSSKSLLKGSVPSTLNTDNSWVEVHLRTINCMDHQAFCLALVAEWEDKGFEWLPVEDSRVKSTYMKKMDTKYDRKMLETYSAFCKFLAVRNLQTYRTTVVPIGSFLLIIFAIAITPLAIATAGSLWMILVPVFVSMIGSVTLRNAFVQIFPKRCR